MKSLEKEYDLSISILDTIYNTIKKFIDDSIDIYNYNNTLNLSKG